MKKLLLVSLMSIGLGGSAGADSFKLLTPLYSFNGGSVAPGAQPYVCTGNKNLQAGYAYDPVNANVLLVDRQTNRANNDTHLMGAVWVLDGLTSNYKNQLQLTNDDGTAVITNGNFYMEGVTVAEDGAVYLCNLVNSSANSSTPFKLYRWPSSMSTTPPVVAFNSNDPQSQWFTNPAAGGANLSLGLSLRARGSGTNTQIICGSRTFQTAIGSNVVVFTTADGTNFSPTILSMTVPPDSFGNKCGCLAFGAGNTFWGKNSSTPLYHMAFDLAARTATVLQSYDTSVLPDSSKWGPIAVDAANNRLATLVFKVGADEFRLYDISNLGLPPVLLDSKMNPYSTADTLSGYIDFGVGTYLHIHDFNNGLHAFTIDDAYPAPPTILVQPLPAAKRLVAGQSLHWEVVATGATSYQWKKNGADISGATTAMFNIASVVAADAGTYTVEARNSAGATPSADAVLTVVTMDSLYHLTSIWSASVTNTYVTSTGGSATPNERSIAYNALSNELYIVQRAGPSSANIAVYAVNGTNPCVSSSPPVLKALKTNGISGGIPLASIAAADDGAIYACNMDNATGAWKLYRWTDSNPNTAPSLIWSGDAQVPGGAGTSAHFRWGDAMAIRGTGLNTQILIDNNEAYDEMSARYAVLFTNSAAGFGNIVDLVESTFLTSGTGPIIGRSLQWESSTDLNNRNFLQRRHAGADPQSIVKSRFDAADGIAYVQATYGGIPSTTAASFCDFAHNLMFLVRTNAGANPYYLDVYDITDLNAPFFINAYPFPQNAYANQNCIAQIAVWNDYVWALAGNNGLVAFQIVSGAPPAPAFVAQPVNQRLMLGGSGSLSVQADSEIKWYTWQKVNGLSVTDVSSGASANTLTFNNAQLSDSGSYRCIMTNLFGSATSSVAVVSIVDPAQMYRLATAWNKTPVSGTTPTAGQYLTGGGAGTPLERSFAFSVRSNQLIISQCAANATKFNINVVDATTGNFLYTLNTNGITHGTSGISGQSFVDVCSVAVDDAGAVYICNLTPHGSGKGGTEVRKFAIYRWADSGPNTLPVRVWSGDPADQTSDVNWGDVMEVRGQGLDTQILVNSRPGTYGAILAPTNSACTGFTNSWWTESAGSAIPRSLQFGAGNTCWSKRSGGPLQQIAFTLGSHTANIPAAYNNGWPSTLPGVVLDLAHNLAAGVNMVSSTAGQDQLALFDVSDLNAPMLIAGYSFPGTHNANANNISKVVFAGNRIFALDANNGMAIFNIVGPQLSVTSSGSQALISWSGNFSGYTLYSAPSLTFPVNWTSEGPGTLVGDQYWVTNNSSGTKFYRIQN